MNNWMKMDIFYITVDCCVSIEELAKPLLSNFVDLTNISPDDLMEVGEYTIMNHYPYYLYIIFKEW